MTLNDFETPHAGNYALGDGGQWVFTEGAEQDWQFVRLTNEQFNRRRIKFKVAFKLPDARKNPRDFYVNIWGGLCLVMVNAQGQLITPDPNVQALYLPESQLSKSRSGWYELTVQYNSFHPSISLGLMSQGLGIYTGAGASLLISGFEVISTEALTAARLEHPVNVIDIGAAFGLHYAWEPYAGQGGHVNVLMFEPSATEAQNLRGMYPGMQVLEVGLSNHKGQVVLHETAHPGCSSVYHPNTPLLAKYRIADWFREVRDHTIPVDRYDTLYASGLATRPDFVKIDVQGYEYEILLGFGDLLNEILVLEVEAHFYPVYHGQKLLHDMVSLMAQHGMMLSAIRPQMNFDDDLVEVNAYFARKPELISPERKPVFEQIMKVMHLGVH